MSNISQRAEILKNNPPDTRKIPGCKRPCIMLLVVLEDRLKEWMCESCGKIIRVSTFGDKVQPSMFD